MAIVAPYLIVNISRTIDCRLRAVANMLGNAFVAGMIDHKLKDKLEGGIRVDTGETEEGIMLQPHPASDAQEQRMSIRMTPMRSQM